MPANIAPYRANLAAGNRQPDTGELSARILTQINERMLSSGSLLSRRPPSVIVSPDPVAAKR
jgi:hypothetical protein